MCRGRDVALAAVNPGSDGALSKPGIHPSTVPSGQDAEQSVVFVLATVRQVLRQWRCRDEAVDGLGVVSDGSPSSVRISAPGRRRPAASGRVRLSLSRPCPAGGADGVRRQNGRRSPPSPIALLAGWRVANQRVATRCPRSFLRSPHPARPQDQRLFKLCGVYQPPTRRRCVPLVWRTSVRYSALPWKWNAATSSTACAGA